MPRVVFFHPDLGIGGAERLIVDAALALKRRQHKVSIYTAHHDHQHCFPETVNGSLDVHCHGDFLPKSFGGHLIALCAIIRMIYLTLYVRFILRLRYDVAIVDQVSACIPFLSGYGTSKVLFYCHYPDQLLTKRKSILKKFYRYFIDWLEAYTTSCADKVLVNSEFTAGVFTQTFNNIISRPAILYPSLDFSKFDSCPSVPYVGLPKECKHFFLSINRFERKKNLALALHAFRHLLDNLKNHHGIEEKTVHLVMAGGYDPRNIENIQHFDELCNIWAELNLEEQATFIKSPSEEVKVNLLRQSTCLLYTPEGEHFGIVPIEAMYCRTPVIAVNSGGPKETVVHNTTGFLCEQSKESFADAMLKFILDSNLKTTMGEAGYERVVSTFSFEKFTNNLHEVVSELVDKKSK